MGDKRKKKQGRVPMDPILVRVHDLETEVTHSYQFMDTPPHYPRTRELVEYYRPEPVMLEIECAMPLPPKLPTHEGTLVLQ